MRIKIGATTLATLALLTAVAGCGKTDPKAETTTTLQTGGDAEKILQTTTLPKVFSYQETKEGKLTQWSRDGLGGWFYLEQTPEKTQGWFFFDKNLYAFNNTSHTWGKVAAGIESCKKTWGATTEFAGRAGPEIDKLLSEYRKTKIAKRLEEVDMGAPSPPRPKRPVVVGVEGNGTGRKYVFSDGAEMITDGDVRLEMHLPADKAREGKWWAVSMTLNETYPIVLTHPEWLGGDTTCDGSPA